LTEPQSIQELVAPGGRRVSSVFRDNGLTIVLGAAFLVSVAGMIASGIAFHNQHLIQHGEPPLTLFRYLISGDFLSALFENWESEFLQMAAYVMLTAILYQRGSAESRDPDDPYRPGDRLNSKWSRYPPLVRWLYAHSLGIVLGCLFIASFIAHWLTSVEAANSEALRHGMAGQSALAYLKDPQLWFESFQNWQSEFLSTAVLVVLSIFLRFKGSPESKPVAAGNEETGD
jgi:hypothetical protein